MESTRKNKIDRLVQKELGDIFQKFTKSQGGVLISVTSVSVSADLSVAKVYLSIFPSEKQSEFLEMIQGAQKSIRYDLSQRTRHQLRQVPELHFYLDDSLDYLENIDRLLGLDKK
ncbi:MAG: 30S ribosome-binding factor RbfA [Paludibacteraceae bacterium]|nr:30S ribosome-binding factor RbfA [Paludibacteraceae bacterium]MBR4714445.1 30S ribosome-binding factor RbfA [Paludibacteraceae bacterium]MBR5373727.1 30S ribosome-binding factor RbfA [Paludibacteraceae bacterium]